MKSLLAALIFEICLFKGLLPEASFKESQPHNIGKETLCIYNLRFCQNEDMDV